MYQKLRDEHIALLRQKADADKKLLAATTTLEESTKIQSELQDSLELARAQVREVDSELNSTKGANEEKIKQLVNENQQLLDVKNELQVITLGKNKHLVNSNMLLLVFF